MITTILMQIRNFLIFIAGILSSGIISCTHKGATLSDLGPWTREYLSHSKAEIAEQRTAGDKLLSDLASALERGDKIFKAEPRIYRLSKGFRFSNLNDFTFDGQNSTILFDVDYSWKGGVVVVSCNNLIFRNVTMDWTRLTTTQGRILEVDRNNNTVLFKPDKGYDEFYDDMRNGPARLGPGTWRLFVFDENGNFSKYQVRMTALNVDGGDRPFTKADENGNYRFKVVPARWTPDQKGVCVGARVALCCRQGSFLFNFGDCGPVTLENITCHGVPYQFVRSDGGEGPVHLVNVNLVRQQGTNRLLTSGADAFIISKMKNGPIVENCKVEGITDDFVNSGAASIPVYAQKGQTEILVRPFSLNGDSTPVLHFQENGTCRFLGEIRIKSISTAWNWVLPSGWDKQYIIPAFRKGTKGYRPGDTIQIWTVRLDKPLEIVKNGAICTSMSAMNSGTVVRNCDFSNGAVRGLLFHTHNALIENNRFTNILESPVTMIQEFSYWGSALIAKNFIIRNNTFTETNGRALSHAYSGAIQIGMEVDPPVDPKYGEWVDSVKIIDNIFIRPGGSAIAINGGRNITITGNRFEECGNLPFHGMYRQPGQYGLPVAVYAGEKIVQKNNTVLHSGLYSLDQ
jgi:hypothetical protein